MDQLSIGMSATSIQKIDWLWLQISVYITISSGTIDKYHKFGKHMLQIYRYKIIIYKYLEVGQYSEDYIVQP